MLWGVSDMIDALRYTVQDWRISDIVKYSLPDGLYCAAYILFIDAIWHDDESFIKYYIISLVPLVTIISEILQYFGLVRGTFDIYDLICYSLPLIIYYAYKVYSKDKQYVKNHLTKNISSSLVFLFFVLGFSASDEDYSANNQVAEVAEEESVGTTKSIYEIQDINELRKALNNTVWTHTKNGDQWLRYEFIGNKVKQYSALPKYGEWRYDGESQYSLSERSTQYDGRKFFVATFKPMTESLAVFDLDVVFNLEDYHLYLNGQNVGGFVKDDYVFN